ncbi:MAG: hypothetical protein NVV82_23835 [Sporocytophaga sp.]|nr:hypothetical protein [Sporocytophaga sp.]
MIGRGWIQTITDSGIIVDDPFGKSVLKEGANRSWEGYNTPTNHSERNYNSKQSNNVGEDVLWSWSSVEKHQFRWIAYLNRATK